MKKIIAAFARRRIVWAFVGAAVLGAAYLFMTPDAADQPYVTAAVDRGSVAKTVDVSGKLRLPDTVNIGAEVSGQVKRVLVDFNSQVQSGQVLLEIDPARLSSVVEQHDAAISQATARLHEAQASSTRLSAELDLAVQNHTRRSTLASRGYLSPMALSESEARVASASAERASAEAGVQSARADIAQARAALESAKLDLSLTRIVSPVDGIVTNRLVQPGQTIVSSFQTTPLFEIAPQNAKIRIEALVDQADIGLVRIGQTARFTVDAYPDEYFDAVVSEIRRTPVETQNVVSYTVIMTVSNPSDRLMAGMSADISVILAQRRGSIRVPISALHYRPEGTSRIDVGEGRNAAVWIPSTDGSSPSKRTVKVGLISEQFAEIVSGLMPGEKVVLRRANDQSE